MKSLLLFLFLSLFLTIPALATTDHEWAIALYNRPVSTWTAQEKSKKKKYCSALRGFEGAANMAAINGTKAPSRDSLVGEFGPASKSEEIGLCRNYSPHTGYNVAGKGPSTPPCEMSNEFMSAWHASHEDRGLVNVNKTEISFRQERGEHKGELLTLAYVVFRDFPQKIARPSLRGFSGKNGMFEYPVVQRGQLVHLLLLNEDCSIVYDSGEIFVNDLKSKLAKIIPSTVRYELVW